jgi:hypothetical protein
MHSEDVINDGLCTHACSNIINFAASIYKKLKSEGQNAVCSYDFGNLRSRIRFNISFDSLFSFGKIYIITIFSIIRIQYCCEMCIRPMIVYRTLFIILYDP